MRVWLDGLRPAPEGWTHARTQGEAITLLEGGGVTDISLDHDLGEPESEVGSGYGVACWIEERAAVGELAPMAWAIHSANPVGRERMRAALESAAHFWESRTP